MRRGRLLETMGRSHAWPHDFRLPRLYCDGLGLKDSVQSTKCKVKKGQQHFPMGTNILTCRCARRSDGRECLEFCTLHFSLCTQLDHANRHSRSRTTTERRDDAIRLAVIPTIDDADKRATVVPHLSKEAARCRGNVHL